MSVNKEQSETDVIGEKSQGWQGKLGSVATHLRFGEIFSSHIVHIYC